MHQFFDPSYETSEVFNAISYSDRALLCKISQDILSASSKDFIITAHNYLRAVVDNFFSLDRLKLKSTIIRSVFDFVTYWGPDNEFSAHMDYILYRNYDEEDPTYDYFALKTKVWIEPDYGKVTSIKTKSLQWFSNHIELVLWCFLLLSDTGTLIQHLQPQHKMHL